MKVFGGVKGLLLNKDALNRFGLIAAELNRICEEFCAANNIGQNSRTEHYQHSISFNNRILSNTSKLSEKLESFEVTFDKNENVYNIITKSVLPEKVQKQVLSHKLTGYELYQSFVSNRINGGLSIWSPLKKANTLTFESSYKTVKTKIEGKMVVLKEDKTLMPRTLRSQKRKGIDLPTLFGDYECSVVPRSIFCHDGTLLPCNNKYKVLHFIEDLIAKNKEMLVNNLPTVEHELSKVVIFDGMALLDRVNKTKDVKTCQDLEDIFIDKLPKESEGFHEIRLVSTDILQILSNSIPEKNEHQVTQLDI